MLLVFIKLLLVILSIISSLDFPVVKRQFSKLKFRFGILQCALVSKVLNSVLLPLDFVWTFKEQTFITDSEK